MLTTSLVRRHNPPPSDVLTWEVGHVVLDGRTQVGWGFVRWGRLWSRYDVTARLFSFFVRNRHTDVDSLFSVKRRNGEVGCVSNDVSNVTSKQALLKQRCKEIVGGSFGARFGITSLQVEK